MPSPRSPRPAAVTPTPKRWPTPEPVPEHKGGGRPRPTEAVARALAAIEADGREGIWISRTPPAVAHRAALHVEQRLAAGERLPLAGTTIAVKDNIDVAGHATTAACPAFAYQPGADAAVVGALVAAGTVVVGKTNLDQFATGLLGTRSGYGLCPNAHWPQLVSGGSSSGSAVAVAAGLVDLALGTDTAGSGRVPAATNGIVGLKPTRGRFSTAGVVPACRSLDCVSVFARSVELAALTAELAAVTSPDPADPWSRRMALTRVPGRRLRVGVPRSDQLSFDGDRRGPADFEQAMGVMEAAGVELRAVDAAPFLEAGRLLYGGAFVAERFEAVGEFALGHPDALHPVVRSILTAAGRLAAWELFRDQTELRRLAASTAGCWAGVDLLVVPTVPRVPTVAEALAEPLGVNTMLGTYTNFVNLLDLCALALPLASDRSGADADRPPVSITLIGPAGADHVLLSAARQLPLGTPANLRTT